MATRDSLVSVVIPCHNAEAWIGETLESVAIQRDVACEVILVDDGSTDGGHEAVASCGDPRARLIRQANAGPGAARNRGLKLLHMACLADNQRMQQLAGKFDAELTFDFGSVIGEVETAHPTPLSVMQELVADSHGFATAVLEVQSRLLRPG